MYRRTVRECAVAEGAVVEKQLWLLHAVYSQVVTICTSTFHTRVGTL